MYCYCVEVRHSKGRIPNAECWRGATYVYKHETDAINALKEWGFREMPISMWPTQLVSSLVWHGKTPLSDDYETATANVIKCKFIE